ncbi:helix-turn-helix transcriptional regulator, partial [Actinocatenispora sera]|uniref:Transcriptional regulator n=1 Tax=Actinocatenispora sera TaxID=390989 RepID=A0A810LAJ5_9ACTN
MDAEHQPLPDALSGLSALVDPIRRRLYDYVAGQDSPVRREAAAAAVGISRTLAAYHLDRLTEAGLLAATYARPEGQGGPGAGRPAKHYQRSADEVSVTVPPRTYVLLARLLTDAVATDPTGAVRAALMTAAESEGRAGTGRPAASDTGDTAAPDTGRRPAAAPETGSRSGGTAGSAAEDPGTRVAGGLLGALQARGYEPAVTDDGTIDLRNCPFHQLARHQPELTCQLNHALVRGVLAGHGADPDRAQLMPRPGRCCVLVHPAQ